MPKDSRASFTLIELLIVIGIVAVLGTIVVLTINPAELLRQARDSKRLSEVVTLNKAVTLFQVDNPGNTPGAGLNCSGNNCVYISLPDSSTDCSTHTSELPSLPAGWEYRCVDENSFRNTDGTGWIPIDLASLSIGSPLAALPIDPQNDSLSGLYYIYLAQGKGYILASLLESKKQIQESAAKDGGVDPTKLETGSDQDLLAEIIGLVGYWKFDEGSGTKAADSSGKGNDGTLVGAVLPEWTTGKFGGALNFNQNFNNNMVQVPHSSDLDLSGPFTLSAWVNPDTTGGTRIILTKHYPTTPGAGWYQMSFRSGLVETHIFRATGDDGWSFGSAAFGWQHIAGRYTGSDLKVFVNGAPPTLTDTLVGTPNSGTDYLGIGAPDLISTLRLKGVIDDVRVYNRALSDSEIQALYNAGN